MATSLSIRLKKGADGRIASFALHRSDGSVTVQRNPHAFFPVHDITHYAVETTLGYTRAFYGLVTEGWGFDDFGKPWPRGRIPEDSEPAELIVGFLDLERATGYLMSADDVNEKMRAYYRDQAARDCAFTVSEEQLTEIRRRRSELTARWHELPPGGTLVLMFTPGDTSMHVVA